MRFFEWFKRTFRLDIYFWMLFLFIPYVIIFGLVGHLCEPVIYIHSVVDDMIPFNEWFIIPYVMWFPYVALHFIRLFYKDTREYLSYMVAQFIGLYVCDIFFILVPNGVDFRPPAPTGGLTGFLCGIVFGLDEPTNVFPSIHVMVSWVVFFSMLHCKMYKQYKWAIPVYFILSTAITLSTMYLKQHSFIDVVGGLIGSVILYLIVYVSPLKKKLDRFYEKHPPKVYS